MVIGVAVITLRLHECRSLKAKRRIIKSIIQKIRNNFNVSVSEVGSNDIYQKGEIGIAMAGTDRQLINSKIDKLLNLIDDIGLAEIVDTDMEIINY